MIRVFKATFNGTDYYDSDIENILGEIKTLFHEVDDISSGCKVEIEELFMRQEELEAMPEFNGW